MNLAMQFALVTYLLLGELGLKIVQSQIGKPVPPDKLKYSQKEALELTNRLRSKHQAPALQYDEVLLRKATDCTKHYVQRGYIDHSCPYARDQGHGENIARLVEYPNISDAIQYAVQSWYNEIKNYSFDDPKKSEGFLVGHFTQLVWKRIRWVGMDAIETEGNETYIVAIYDPPGNMKVLGHPAGQFVLYKQNVVPPTYRNATSPYYAVSHIHRNVTSTYKVVSPIHRNTSTVFNNLQPGNGGAASYNLPSLGCWLVLVPIICR